MKRFLNSLLQRLSPKRGISPDHTASQFAEGPASRWLSQLLTGAFATLWCCASWAVPTPSINGFAASDNTYTDKVRLTWSMGGMGCAEVDHITVYRDGVNIGDNSEASAHDDTTAVPGVTYTYRIVVHFVDLAAACRPGDFGSSNDAGTRAVAVAPTPISGVVASDGLYSDRVAISYSVPNNSGSCSNIEHRVFRDGAQIGVASTSLTGGGFAYNDSAATPGVTYSYSFRSECLSTSLGSDGGSDTGWRLGIPLSPTGVSASDGTYVDRVRVTWTAPNQSGQCSGISYVVTRDGADLATASYSTLTGGSASHDDTSAVPGVSYSYGIRAVCSPGSQSTASATDSGFRAGIPLAPSGIVASDGSFTDKVRISWTAPNQTGQCASIAYVVTRDGVDLATSTFTTIGGGSAYYDDTSAVAPTSYSYNVRAVCTPGGQTATGSADSGYRAGVPLVSTSVSATDGTLTDRVRVSWNAPNQTGLCSSISYVVTRNGSDLATSTFTTLTGGTPFYDDTTASPGTSYTYAIRSVCSPGGQTSASSGDTGYRAGTPSAPTGVSASDGVYTDRVRISFTAPNQSGQCSSVTYQVFRDGSLSGTVSTVPVTGGSSFYDDTTAVPMTTYTYMVQAVCSPGSVIAAGGSDTGYRLGSPIAPTGVSASDGTRTTDVQVSWTAPNQSAQCSSVQYDILRNGSFLATSTFTTLTGGSPTYTDTTAVPSVSYSYSIRVNCSPSGTNSVSAADSGFRGGIPAAATGVTASDGTIAGAVRISFNAPNQSSQCASANYVITRNGADLTTISTVPLAGGSTNFDDTTAAVSVVYTYAVRATCGPGPNTAASSGDTGYRAGIPAAATNVVATDGTFPDRVRVTFDAPNQSTQCTSIAYVLVRNGADVGPVAGVPLTGGSGFSADDMSPGVGTNAYTVRAECSPGAGATVSAPDNGYKLTYPAAPTAVTASDGAFSDRVRVNWTAPDQTPFCTSVNYLVSRDGVPIGAVNGYSLTGGAAGYDDMTVPVGVYTYAVSAQCLPSSAQTAAATSDTGFKAPQPFQPSSVVASDGTYTDRVRINFTAPDQTSRCSSVTYTVTMDGVDVAPVPGVPLAGGAAQYDVLAVSVGTHAFRVRADCSPGGGNTISPPDNGFQLYVPLPATSLAASDFTYTDRVRIGFVAPDQSSRCSSISYAIVRDGSDIGTLVSVPLTGSGAAFFDDTTAAPGATYTYSVRAICMPGAQTASSSSDAGGRAAMPAAPTLTASDYTVDDRTVLNVSSPAAPGCSTIGVVIARDGVDITTVTSIPASGGSATYDDVGPAFGAHTYSARTVCAPGGQTSSSANDIGGRRGWPVAPTTITASDATFTDRVRLNVDVPASPQCTTRGIVISRNGADIGTVNSVLVSGGSFSYDDTTAPNGPLTYAVRSRCLPGGTESSSISDVGSLLGVAPPPSSVVASDFAFPDRVSVQAEIPAAPACSTRDVVVRRDGAIVYTDSSVPVSGGTMVWNDTAADLGVHTYGVTTVCFPGSAESASVNDAGSKRYPAPTCAAVSSPAAVFYPYSPNAAVTVSGVTNAGQVRVRAWGATGGTNDLMTYLAAGGPATYTTGVTLSNHATGSPEYGTINLEAMVTGKNPGDLEVSCATSSFVMADAPLPTAVLASDFAYLDRVRVTATVPVAPACTSLSVQFLRGGTLLDTQVLGSPSGPTDVMYEDIGGPSGVFNYGVRTVCSVGADSFTSAAVTDPGSRSYGDPVCTTVGAAQPKFVYSAGLLIPVTAVNPSNFSAIRLSAYGVADGEGDRTSYSMTPSGGNQVGSLNLSNHATGGPEYGPLNIELLVTGRDPGAVEQVCATTSIEVVRGCGSMTLSGPSGTGPLPSTISWNADSAATQYVLQSSASVSGPFVDAGMFGVGTTSTSVPGWPALYYRVQCVAADPFGNSMSPAVRIAGNPPPVVTPQTFTALNPMTTSVTPVVTDPDGNTTFTLSISVPPAHGTAVVVGSAIEYTPNAAFFGDDPFTVVATDPLGAEGSAVLTAAVEPLVPGMPTNVKATDGTVLGSVSITWDAGAHALSYKVLRRNSIADPSPVVVGTPSTTSYSDATAAPGVSYRYTVVSVNGSSESDESVSDTGFADTAPVSISWTGATVLNTAVEAVPAYTDADAGDIPVYSIVSPPSNGTASVVGGKVRYVPTLGFVGTDTFGIRGTDRAAAFVDGTGTATVSCPAATLNTPAVAPARLFVGGGFSISATYDTGGCNQPSTVTYELLSSGTTVASDSTAASLTPGPRTTTFDTLSPSAPGMYTLRIVLTNDVSGAKVERTTSVSVQTFRPPALQWLATPYLESADTAVLRAIPSTDCALTTDPAVAMADPAKCLLEMSNLPPGVSGGLQTFTVSFNGVPTAAGDYATSGDVSMYSPGGEKRLMATIPAPVQVLPLGSLAFSTPASISSKRVVEVYSSTPVQTAGPECQLTTVALARELALTGRRGCVVDWDPLPADAYQEVNTLKGVHFSLDPVVATWKVSVVNAAGDKIPAATGSTTLVPVASDVAFGVAVNPSVPYSILTTATVVGKSTGADICGVTASESEATRLSPRLCLIEWGSVPGLVADTSSFTPTLRGVFPTDGLVPIPWKASIIYRGAKREIAAGNAYVNVSPAQPPTLNIDRLREVAPDVYGVPVTGGYVGMLSTSTLQGQVNGTLDVTAEATANFTLLGNRNKQPLVAGASTLYTERDLQVGLQLQAAPALVSSRTIRIVSVPRDGLRLRINSPPTSAPDTVPLVVTATIVQPTTEGLKYVGEEAGQWAVVFGEVSSSGAFLPLSGAIETDGTGTASTSIDLTGRANLRLQARATPVSPYPSYAPSLTSYTSVVTVSKGTPIAATLSSSAGLTGPGPFLSAYRVNFTTLADHIFNDRYTWFTSSDNGATWNLVPGADGPQYALRFTAGTHQVKVKLRNKATLEESETEPITLEVYNVPKVVVTGPMFLYPTNTGTFSLAAVDSVGAAYPGAVFEWTITQYGASASDPPLASGTSDSISYTPTAPGIFRLTIRARDSSTSATDTKAWFQTMYQFIGLNPTPVSVAISGPVRAEVGKGYLWTALTQPTFDISKSNLTIGGQWTLPDGTIVPGASLNWTPSAADMALTTRPQLKFSAWINGYEATTTTTKTFQLTLWQYVWPTWRISRTATSTMAPSNVQYVVLPDNNLLLPVLEGLTYTWSVPPSVAVVGTPTSKLVGTIGTSTTATVSVVVADARGNSQLIEDTISVDSPPPIVVDVTATNFSKWSHAPITLGVTAKASGGHPLDPIATWEYFLNGVKVPTSNSYNARLNLPDPGAYTVEVKATSRAGASATRAVLVNVPSNIAPSCLPEATLAVNRRNISVRAGCTDPDGGIVKYAWFFNGMPLATNLGASFSYILPATQVFPLNIEVQVTDDGGGTASGSTVVN